MIQSAVQILYFRSLLLYFVVTLSFYLYKNAHLDRTYCVTYIVQGDRELSSTVYGVNRPQQGVSLHLHVHPNLYNIYLTDFLSRSLLYIRCIASIYV